jgi:cytochrome c biogenesis protein CcmG, thiol:disulfide interchange protein DsbE
MTENTTEHAGARRSPLYFILPLGIFAVIAVMFLFKIVSNRDPSEIPSPLIGKPAPQFSLPALEQLQRNGSAIPGFTTADLTKGTPTMIVVWGAYCIPCAQEAPALLAFKAKFGVRLFGLNYKDKPEAARAFLARYGNPFDAVGDDRSGRVSIDWGIYGAPETFIVDGRGTIVYKYVGPLTPSVLQNEVLNALTKAGKLG